MPSIEQVFDAVLMKGNELGASDIHLCAGSPFRMRVNGRIVTLSGAPPLTPRDTEQIVAKILLAAKRANPENLEEKLRDLMDEDCSYSVERTSRYRVNICSQRGSFALVLRAIPFVIPAFEDLALPPVLTDLASEERGLVLVTGITGSGKSTTLASMVNYINKTRGGKIITIEDPIEYLYRDDKASIMQREIGSDTLSFAKALRAALRQDPDVILVGEMRDQETIDIALKAAETGHLVLSTLHTTDAPKTIMRMIGVFDLSEQTIIRQRLSETLKAVVSQRLLPRKDESGRIAALEIMRTTLSIKECIEIPEKLDNIKDFMSRSAEQYGMQTFDMHLARLYREELITFETARAAATSPADFERNTQFE
ncbi:MAG: type IV pilus twitching motility protein PilT [Acidobacteria bacterium]|nr:type IV pilus twitching motility protein PilT [Acidobacteriota bacterium]MBI3656602.1 type IV pilus twitching motility protein PilT [Acidobacteriota bacterium]